MANQATLDALREALADEYRARATYRKVIETFGPVRPFVNIVESEERHAQALLAQFHRLGAPPPPDEWDGRMSAPPTVAAACAQAVQAEIDNAAMYRRLVAQVDDPIVRQVLSQLEEASQQRHLPAFERCVARQAGATDGRGAR